MCKWQAGDWLCLKNLHLVVAWLPALEKELIALKPAPSFRLWLTTEPHAAFPPVLLQSALKVTRTLLHVLELAVVRYVLLVCTAV
jgi:Dynein heavy chain region D6 P-loop domain